MQIKTKHYLIGFLVIIIVSFGVNQVYEMGQRDIQRKVQLEQERKQMELERQQRERERIRKIQMLKDEIPHKQAELQLAINKLNQINQWEFLRTAAEKEAQLAKQNKVINSIKSDLDLMERNLSELENTRY